MAGGSWGAGGPVGRTSLLQPCAPTPVPSRLLPCHQIPPASGRRVTGTPPWATVCSEGRGCHTAEAALAHRRHPGQGPGLCLDQVLRGHAHALENTQARAPSTRAHTRRHTGLHTHTCFMHTPGTHMRTHTQSKGLTHTFWWPSGDLSGGTLRWLLSSLDRAGAGTPYPQLPRPPRQASQAPWIGGPHCRSGLWTSG